MSLARPAQRLVSPSAVFLVAATVTSSLAAQTSAPVWARIRAPVGRSAAGLAVLPATGRLLLFGGATSDLAGVLGDTWVFDGQLWDARTGDVAPAPRKDFAMASDPVRGEVVLFGGSDGTSYDRETWVFDGSAWQSVQPTQAPPAWPGRMVCHAGRQRLVWLGGLSNQNSECWEWDGQSWSLLSLGNPPVRGTDLALAYDAVRQELVAFDGASTWTWGTGTAWTRHATGVTPGPRGETALAFDAMAGRVVLFGGQTTQGSQTTAHADLWEWDGSSWTQRMLGSAPEARHGHSLVSDPAGGVLLHGGEAPALDGKVTDVWSLRGSAVTRRAFAYARPWHPVDLVLDTRRRRNVTVVAVPGQSLLQVMEFDGARWHAPATTLAPQSRESTALAYDAGRGVTVLFGGYQQGVGNFGDTWEWDGQTWTQRSAVQSPPSTNGHAMAYDPRRGRVVLFGGSGSTWEWDGSTWHHPQPAQEPPSTAAGSMAWFPLRQRIVYSGGHWVPNPPAPSYLRELWEWDGQSWTQAGTSTYGADHVGMTYDPAQGVLVLAGGRTWNPIPGWVPRNDVVVWDGSTCTKVGTLGMPGGPCELSALPAGEGVLLTGNLTVGTVFGTIPVYAPRSMAWRVPFSATQTRHGQACAGSRGAPVLVSGAAIPGNVAFALEIQRALPNTAALVALAGARTSVPVAPGCTWELGLGFDAWPLLVDPRGVARMPLPLPLAPSLCGLRALAAGLVLDGGGTPPGLSWTAATEFVVGY